MSTPAGVVSGHTLKHIVAGLAAAFILLMLWHRSAAHAERGWGHGICFPSLIVALNKWRRFQGKYGPCTAFQGGKGRSESNRGVSVDLAFRERSSRARALPTNWRTRELVAIALVRGRDEQVDHRDPLLLDPALQPLAEVGLLRLVNAARLPEDLARLMSA